MTTLQPTTPPPAASVDSSRKARPAAARKYATKRTPIDYLWPYWVTWDGMSAQAMMEDWEIVLYLTVCAILALCFLYSMVFYFPSHVRFIQRRATYYITGLGQRATQYAMTSMSTEGANLKTEL